MRTAITILVENTAGRRGTVGESGFSAWITRGTAHTLFDTGCGNGLLLNAKCLRKDLCQIRRLVLSHGHWDHTGGLKQLLELRGETDIVAHPGIFAQHVSRRNVENPPKYRDAGIPFSREELEQLGAQFHLTREYHELEPGMYFSGEIMRPQDWESADKGLYLKQNDEYVPDPVLDDVSLLLETEHGPVVLFGCAHAGADTILNYLSEKSGHSSFYAVIGGTHLVRANDQRIDEVIASFEKYHVQKVGTMHCTGFHAMTRLYQHFQGRFEVAHVGSCFEF